MSDQVTIYDSTIGREAVARLIVGVELPISFGKNLFYEEFMKNFIPNYQAFSKGAIWSDILRLFTMKKLELQDEFRRSMFSIALTSEIWSGRAK